MEVVNSKVVSGIVIFVVTLLSGVAPYVAFRVAAARRASRTEAILDHMQAFASGVFIAICLLYLVPEAREAVTDSIDSELPVAEIIMSAGVLLILIVEQVFVSYMEAKQKDSGGPVLGHHHHGHNHHNKNLSSSSNVATLRQNPNGGHGDTYHNYGSVDDLLAISADDEKQRGGTGGDVMPFPHPRVSEEGQPLLRSDKSGKTTPATISHANGTLSFPAGKAQNGGIAGDALQAGSSEEARPNVNESVLKSLVLLLALSFHTVFDGLVVGVQHTEADVWTLLIAIGLHKALEGLSLSLSLLDSHRHRPGTLFLYLFLFSLVSPLGLAIGTVLTESNIDEHAQTLTSGVLQSVATGTFMYATFVESLKERFDGGARERLGKVLCVVTGFACLCVVRIFLPEHGHEHEH